MILACGGKNRIKLTSSATIAKCTAVDRPPVRLKRNTSGTISFILLVISKKSDPLLYNLELIIHLLWLNGKNSLAK